jgi:hypothetical protein
VKVSMKFIDRQRVWRSLRNYPIFALPFARADSVLSREEMDANYHCFLKQRSAARGNYGQFVRRFVRSMQRGRDGGSP